MSVHAALYGKVIAGLLTGAFGGPIGLAAAFAVGLAWGNFVDGSKKDPE